MYQIKLKRLKQQLACLEAGTLPEYLKRLKRIDQQYKERLKLNEVWQECCIENANHSYEMEQIQAKKEFELKKVDLKERLVSDWEEKKRQVENDKTHMELSLDFMDFKPISTRKLRRRVNPDGNTVSTNGGPQEKRRKQSPTINILLDEAAISEDLKIINKVSGKLYTQKKQTQVTNSNDEQVSYDARIEEGKLYFEKRWYLRGQAIYADSKETGKFGAVIQSITGSEIWIKKTSDNSRMKILLTQLQKGKYSIRRRST
ncbi:sin3 histone deacetylase corepressor complex component SDS3-like isoform X2 [Watersipora subatra]